MAKSPACYGLGVYQEKKTVYLFYNNPDDQYKSFLVDDSASGFDFSLKKGKPKIVAADGTTRTTVDCTDFRISTLGKQHILIYTVKAHMADKLFAAVSNDLLKWGILGQITLESSAGFEPLAGPGMIVPDYEYKGKRVMYFGSENIRIGYSSKDLTNWEFGKNPVLSSRPDKFDKGPLRLGSVAVTNKGIVVFYYIANACGKGDCWSVGSALFDKKNPTKCIWRSESPLLEHVEGFLNKHVRPLGIIHQDDSLVSYWDVEDDGIVAISHPVIPGKDAPKKKTLRLVLEKLKKNPILKPIAEHAWESKAVFNPAAVYENGKIHLIYRAVGQDDVSVLGYATSTDGVTIDERLDEPIYVPRASFEGLQPGSAGGFTSPFFSGGAYGGCEDPRITKVGDKYYMMYVAYDGAHPPRVAMSTIKVDDFNNRNWDWTPPVIISQPGVVDKNACVLPEKIDGKFVVFHRIFPNILVDYVDDMDAFDGKSVFLKGDKYIPPRHGYWDSRKIGIGAPPIKTDAGWLLIYQAVDDRDASKYKMGAMLLDHKQPEKVLYRTKKPILQPDMWYENEGLKFGVAYPCGAVIHNDMLRVYYGGADMVVCQAHAPIHQFLEDLTTHEEAELMPTIIKSR
jgi:beta-1,2-mannobiose phosphorylase / 1,2-beta-oligomannan phosphorylase